MAITPRGNNLAHPHSTVLLAMFVCVHLWFQPPAARAQESRDEEVAVNLVEGRVVICATKDAIILAAMSSKGEATSRPPAIEILSAERMGVMLGAVEWEQPDSKESTVRLDQEFRHIIAAAFNNTSKLPKEPDANNDIETIGIALLERIRQVAELLRHKVNLGEDEPLIRIVLAGYVRDYGPEVWTIDYRVRQDLLGNDLWRTRVLRPVYNQLYPPEKGKPKTFMEVRYPPENRATGEAEFLDLLQQNDSRLVKFRTANEVQSKSVTLAVEGQSQKADTASLVNFMKSAFPAVTLPDTKLTMALVDYDAGFKWILQPPKAPAPPPGEKPKEQTPEEPERPSLRRSGGT
jgi:hypothetical protein